MQGLKKYLLLCPSKDEIKIYSFHSSSSPSDNTASLIIHWIIAVKLNNGGKNVSCMTDAR